MNGHTDVFCLQLFVTSRKRVPLNSSAGARSGSASIDLKKLNPNFTFSVLAPAVAARGCSCSLTKDAVNSSEQQVSDAPDHPQLSDPGSPSSRTRHGSLPDQCGTQTRSRQGRVATEDRSHGRASFALLAALQSARRGAARGGAAVLRHRKRGEAVGLITPAPESGPVAV